ncbi:unnamed protein product [Calicophoron daubneyi]|uniref:Uncharacterized protein n=1 Tax=Calicophoron daubneyi TaxID=300641 RepID=A0AAV2TYS4_CALDB
MNPLKWLHLSNEDTPESESFDCSLVLPLTVGLGSVVVSVLLGYRKGLIGNRKKQLDNGTVQTADTVTPSKEMAKRKSGKAQNKPISPSAPETEHKVQRKKPTVPTADSSPFEPTKLEDSVTPQTTVPSTPNSIVPPAPPKAASPAVLPPVHLITEQLTFPPAQPAASENKKHKKPKRSRKSEALGSSIQSGDSDPSWVTVTSKKARQPPTGNPPLVEQVPSSPGSSVASKKAKGADRPTNETNSTPSASVPVAFKQPDICEPEIPITTVHNVESNPVLTRQHITSVSSQVIPSNPPELERVPKKAEMEPLDVDSSPPFPEMSPQQRLTAAYEDILRRSLGPEAIASLRGLLGATVTPASESFQIAKEHKEATISSRPAASTPASNEFLTQHLSSQVQAKEAECQLLRSEVINLREELKSARVSAKSHQHIVIATSTVDAETMTELAEKTDQTKRDVSAVGDEPFAPSAVSATSAKTTEHRSASPDSVLLMTLQAEIGRLAKEVTLSRQRNENLEARLENANCQINTVKAEAAHASKVARKELKKQTDLTQAAEEARLKAESELQNTLQQLEIQRRKAEDGVHSSIQHMNELERVRADFAALSTKFDELQRNQTQTKGEKDELMLEYEALQSRHQKSCSELDETHKRLDDVSGKLEEANSHLQTLQKERGTVVIELEDRIKALESELAAGEQREQAELARFNEMESITKQLRSEIANLQTEIKDRDLKLDDLHSKCAVLEQSLSEAENHQTDGDVKQADQPESLKTNDDQVIAVEPREVLEATTQTDPEPRTEFDSVLVDADGARQLTVTHLQTVEITPKTVVAQSNGTNGVDSSKTQEDLESEIKHYKSALDITESMLSKLQKSVNEEEERWRLALETSRMECELLGTKISKLESSLSDVVDERDGLKKTIQELQKESKQLTDSPVADSQSADGHSSTTLLSLAQALDSTTYDENTPKPELIRLLGRFRHLIQTKHDALKREQASSSQLPKQSDTSNLAHTNNSNFASTNGSHEQLDPTAEVEFSTNEVIDGHPDNAPESPTTKTDYQVEPNGQSNNDIPEETDHKNGVITPSKSAEHSQLDGEAKSMPPVHNGTDCSLLPKKQPNGT